MTAGKDRCPALSASAPPGPCPTCGLVREDVEHLRRLAETLSGHEQAIAERWIARNVARGPGALDAEDLRASAHDEVATILDHVLRCDLGSLWEFFRGRGRELASRGVPFGEVCRGLHEFEESVVAELRGLDLPAETVLDRILALGRLGHQRQALLIEAYHGHCRSEWVRCREAALERAARLERDVAGRDRLCGIVGRSLVMQRLYERLELAARCRDTVFLTGESGTGKEFAARAIHALAGDPSDRFVPVNCAALAPDLMESELFGHRRGAFSGAVDDHPGLFGAARRGTIFLDEVTELTPAAQAKLLRALQEHAIRPVGTLHETPIEVRVLASSNRDPEKSLAAGRLRRDLYYRLQEVVVRMPPLRERLDDVPILVEHLAARYAGEGGDGRVFAPEAMAILSRREWPGNVRELENLVRLLCRMSSARVVEAREVEEALGTGSLDSAGEAASGTAGPLSIKEAERDAISRALRETEGNKTRAAKLLGISRKQLYVKLRRYELA